MGHGDQRTAEASGVLGGIVSEETAPYGGGGLPAHQGRDGCRTQAHPGARLFKKVLGLKWRCVAAIPLPPQKTIEEHAATQAEFLASKLEPVLEDARAGKGQVFFVDAAHFVMGAFLCCVWCLVRVLIRGGSGRKRYSVLGAWNAVTRELVSITTDATVNAETMCALLIKIATLGLQGPITLVLDNARYQHCKMVIDLAKSLNIHLEFLPSYSPNLNLIERLW